LTISNVVFWKNIR